MISIYIHIPFCTYRCAYCDFNTYAGEEQRLPDYIHALRAEISLVAASLKEKLCAHTIFFGGGTPSLLKPEQVSEILDAVRDGMDIQPDVEISMEANPGTVTLESLAAYREVGVNRLSFGAQSFRNEELRLIDRIHNKEDILQGVKWARQAGFDNLNLDLIFGLPGQTLEHWKETLDRAIELFPEHLSLYGLTVEEGTPLHQWVQSGLLQTADEDLSADMYEHACERLEEAEFNQYEISNWARGSLDRDLRCAHNLQYWHNLPYLGFGSGAHGYARGIRTANVKGIREYIQMVDRTKGQSFDFPKGPANDYVEQIDLETEIKETMMVGLRLTQEGINRDRFTRRFGVDVDHLFTRQIDLLRGEGLVELGEYLRLTPKGRLLGNRVFAQFVNAEIKIQ